MGEMPRQDNPQSTQEPDEPIVVHEVPVEHLIPDIKSESEVKKVEGVDYRSNDFSDSFIYDFFRKDVRAMVEGKEYEGLSAELKTDIDFLREKMKGQVVVDLGSDTSWQGYCLASLFGAKGYIGVDFFTKGELEGTTEACLRESLVKRLREVEGIDSKINNHIKPQAIPACIIQGDMLNFLKRLPDGSVSVFAFGISSEIIRYGDKLGEEITRVLNEDGGYLEYGSTIPVEGVKNLFKELWERQFGQPPATRDKYMVSPRFNIGNPGFFVKK